MIALTLIVAIPVIFFLWEIHQIELMINWKMFFTEYNLMKKDEDVQLTPFLDEFFTKISETEKLYRLLSILCFGLPLGEVILTGFQQNQFTAASSMIYFKRKVYLCAFIYLSIVCVTLSCI